MIAPLIKGRKAMRLALLSSFCATALAALMSAMSAAVAQPCSQGAGPRRARELVRRCLQVSPARRPPCNAANPCALIRDGIRRGCALLTTDAPAFCRG